MADPGSGLAKTGRDAKRSVKVTRADRQEGRGLYPVADAGVESLQGCVWNRRNGLLLPRTGV